MRDRLQDLTRLAVIQAIEDNAIAGVLRAKISPDRIETTIFGFEDYCPLKMYVWMEA